MYGRAFRNPSTYERFWNPNPTLVAERINTFELVREQRILQRVNIVPSGFHYRLGGLIEGAAVILMDIQMPMMDGFKATRQIREHEKLRGAHVPIIALTAHALKGDRERCVRAGMDDYVTKPVSRTRLTEAINAAVDTGEAERKESTQNEFGQFV